MPTNLSSWIFVYIGLIIQHFNQSGLLRAVASRYRYCVGATYTVAVAPLRLVEKNGDGSAVTFHNFFWRYALLLSTDNLYFGCQELEVSVDC